MLLFIQLIFSFQVQAELQTRFVCATDHLTTSFALIESESSFELQVMHHNGVEFMPIHNGLITGYDLKLLNEKADLFQKMGMRFTLNFAKSDCQEQDGEWTCFKGGKVALGGLNVQNLKFSLTDRTVTTKATAFDLKVAQLSFVVGSYGYTLPMEYASESCRQN